MRGALIRCHCGMIRWCAMCGDILAAIGFHMGHGHTPWG